MHNEAMVALAERVEADSGADPQLDNDIADATGRRMAAGMCAGGEGYAWYQALTYTASLDAVRTLIDPDEEWDISTQHCIARATVGISRDHQTSWPGYGEHAECDPVRALLAAALRAIDLRARAGKGA